MPSDPGKGAGVASRCARAFAPLGANRLRTARAILWLSVPILAALCGWQFYALRDIRWAEVPIADRQIVATTDDTVRGRVAADLPAWRLNWDGQWPLALLCDARTGEVLGPSLIRADALSNNQRGVRWSQQECEWVVDQTTWNERANQPLVLRCQEIPSRVPFYCLGLGAIFAGLAAIFCGQVRRVQLAAEPQRRQVLAAEMRRSLFIVLSLLAAAAYFPGFGLTCPGDVANINSFAAGLDSPQIFEHDALLGDPRNFAWYTPLYVKLVRACGAIGFHYDTSRALLALVATAAGLFGYFQLFRSVSRSNSFALAAALGLWLFSGSYPSKEAWSPELILPRTLFAALLPWSLLAGLWFQRRPKQWAIPAALAALLFYVHPVSAPALIGAMLTGFVVGGRRWTLGRTGWGIAAAVAAISVMLPYVLVYAGKYAGTITEDPAVLRQSLKIARSSFGAGILSPTAVLSDIWQLAKTEYRFWPALAALVWLLACRRHSRAVRILVTMTVGYVIVMLVLPTADLMLAARRNQLPFQVDLFRNIRYVDVWLLLVVGVALREASRSWRRGVWAARAQRAPVWPALAWPTLASVLLVLVSYGPTASRSVVGLVNSAKSNCSVLQGSTPNEIEALRALLSMRKPYEVVSGPIALRQWNIPVAFTSKDRGALIYSNPQRLVEWQQAMDRCRSHLQAPIDSADVAVLSSVLGADLVLLPRKLADPELMHDSQRLYCNPSWVLLRYDRVRTARAVPPAQVTGMPSTP